MTAPQEITEYLATKLTSTQKRGRNLKTEERGQIDVGNREIVGTVIPRSHQELVNAQLNLAKMALEHPDLATDEEREAWLREVLEYLALDEPITRKQRKLLPIACWPWTGTERGYNVHLRTYTNPCSVCAREHEKILTEKHKSMGIEHGGRIT